VIIPPPGSRGGVEVRGGGPGTRELEPLAPLANAEGPTAVLFTGGSAFGLAAADGVISWLEEGGRGRQTPIGVVPLVPTAVIYDLQAGGERPGPVMGYEACANAAPGVPERGPVGAGAGAGVGKSLGRERGSRGGVGYGAAVAPGGATVAVVVVANSVGDVIGADGAVIGGPHDEQGRLLRSAELIAASDVFAASRLRPDESTTLVCVCTDASLDKRGCGIVARMAVAGVARAVDPVFSPLDGDVVFCVASGPDRPSEPGVANSLALTTLGTLAATVTAAAIRDAVLCSAA
jgi:putative pantetheine hydrolase